MGPILSRVFPAPADLAPDITLRPRNRRLSKSATDKSRPIVAVRDWFASRDARPGFIAVFVLDAWPMHVHYDAESASCARELATADLQRLKSGWGFRRDIDARYFTLVELDLDG